MKIIERNMNMPKPKSIEEIQSEAKDTYAKTFSFAVGVLEFLAKTKGGVFDKTSVSAIWYHDGSFDRVTYDPDLSASAEWVAGRKKVLLPLCPTAESYSEGAEFGSTMGLMSPQDVADYWEIIPTADCDGFSG